MNKKTFVKIRKIITAIFACLLLLGTDSNAAARGREAVLLGYIVLPDISQTLDQISKIAGTIDPAKFKPGELKARAGAALGDPALENIDKTKPIVIMVFHRISEYSSGMSSIRDLEFAAVIPVKDKVRYSNAFNRIHLPFETNGNKIIVSNKKSSLFFAQREMKFYRELSSQSDNYDARFLIKIDNITSVYGSMITMLMQQLQALDSSNLNKGENIQDASLMSIGKIFIYAMVDLVAQSNDYQFDVKFSDTAIDFSSEHSTLPGSALSRFFDGKPKGTNKSLSLLPEKGQLTCAGYFDTKRFRDLIENLLSEALKLDPALEKDINRTLIDAYMDYFEVYTGEFALTYGFDTAGLQMNIAASTGSSSGEFEEINDRFMTLYNEALKKIGGGISGISGYTIEKNFRKSNGIDVHRYIIDMENSKMTDIEKKMFQNMFGKEFSIEYALSNGYIAASTNPANLDRIITNTVTKPAVTVELLSIKAFGTGMDSYIDFDMISFLENIINLSSEINTDRTDPSLKRFQNILKNTFKDNRNILFSSKYRGGTSFSRCRIPVKMITGIMKSINQQNKEESIPENDSEMPTEDESEE